MRPDPSRQKLTRTAAKRSLNDILGSLLDTYAKEERGMAKEAKEKLWLEDYELFRENALAFLGLTAFWHGPEFQTATDAVVDAELFKAPVQPLEEGFEDWQEWEKIVLSALRARVKLDVPKRTGRYTFRERSFVHKTLNGEFAEGYTSEDWMGAFSFLQTNGKLKFEDAFLFFKRIDMRLREFKQNRTGRVASRRRAVMVLNWVGHADTTGSVYQPLCMMDDRSATFVLEQLEKIAAVANRKVDCEMFADTPPPAQGNRI